MDTQSLNQQFGIESKAIFANGERGLTKLDINAPGGSCEIYLHGAHVTSFVPTGEKPVLWMSRKSEFKSGSPIRGGIPICFPWFGLHPTNPDLPGHGFVRLGEWCIESVAETGDTITAQFSTASTTESHKVWPHSFRATYTVTVGSSLEVTLAVTNTGTSDLTFTEALHSYFNISDIRFVTVDGLDGASYLDKLLETDEALVQRGAIQFTAETDRPYLDTDATCTIDDPGLSRRIIIEKRGSKSTVVWNPWIAKARRMEDFGDDEWTGMLCVETANALDNSVSLAPGASHEITALISVAGA